MENQPVTPVPTVLEPIMPTASKPNGKNWRPLIGLFFIIGVLIMAAIWYFVIFSPSQKNTIPPISTAAWQTRSSSTMGFEVKIPADWGAQSEVVTPLDEKGKKKYVVEFIYPAQQKINPDAKVTISKYPGTIASADQEAAIFQRDAGVVMSKVTVAGREATSAQFANVQNIYFAQGDSIYLLTFMTAESTPFTKYSPTFNQVLSTFKLL